MTIISTKELVEQALTEIKRMSLEDAISRLGDESLMFIDIRDIRELNKVGRIPGAHHAPRGMLEFWFDPQSPYHKVKFASDKKKVLFCAGAWRSALAAKTLQDMGITNICDMEGGFSAWVKAGGPIEEPTGDKDA